MKHRDRYVLLDLVCGLFTIVDVDESPARVVCMVPKCGNADGQADDRGARAMLEVLNRDAYVREQVNSATPPSGGAA